MRTTWERYENYMGEISEQHGRDMRTTWVVIHMMRQIVKEEVAKDIKDNHERLCLKYN